MVLKNHKNPSKPASLQDHILVYWPDDKEFYPGVITELTQDGKVVVHYDDGDFETLLLHDEVWKFVQTPQTPRDGSSKSGPSTSSRATSEDVMLPPKQVSVHPGTSSNQHSKSTVNTDRTPKIATRASRKRAASSSNGEHTVPRKRMVLEKAVKGTFSGLKPFEAIPVPRTGNRKRVKKVSAGTADVLGSRKRADLSSNVEHPIPRRKRVVLDKTVKGTSSEVTPIEDIPVPRKRVKKVSAGTTDVLVSRKRAGSSSNAMGMVLKQQALRKTIINQTPPRLTHGDAIVNPRNIVRTAAAVPKDAIRKHAASSARAFANDVQISRKRSASCSNFGNPVPKKKAPLSKSVKHNPYGSPQAATIDIPHTETRFAAKPPLQPKPRVAPNRTIDQPMRARSSTSYFANPFSRKKALPSLQPKPRVSSAPTNVQPERAGPSTSNVVNILSNQKVLPIPSGKRIPSRPSPVDKVTIDPTEKESATKEVLQPKLRVPSTRTTPQPKLARPVKSNVVNPVRKENTHLTASAKDNPSSSTAPDTITNPHTKTGFATKPPLQAESRVVVLANEEQRFSRPLTPGAPIPEHESEPSTRLRPIQKLIGKLSQDLELSLDPHAASVKAQLNTLVPRISSMHDMLRKTYSRATVSDEICKRLRADVENLESEVSSRAEMNKVLDDAFVKQVEELKSFQTELLKQLKKDFKSFVQDEMNTIEKDLLEKVRAKSVEVFKEKFREVAESTKDPAVKNAIEYMSLRTVPCKSTGKKYGASPSRSE